MGWSTAKSYVTTILATEANSLTDSELLVLLNEAIDRLNERLRVIPYKFTGANMTSAGHDESMYYATLPNDLVGNLETVYQDIDVEVYPMHLSEFFETFRADALCDERYAIQGRTFYCSVPINAKLKLRGWKALPYYVIPGSPTPVDTDPMGNLPRGYDLLPAYWVLGTYRYASSTDVEAARVQKYLQMFNDGVIRADYALASISGKAYS